MAKFSNLLKTKVIEAPRFWIIGDVHGMNTQFEQLLQQIKEYDLGGEVPVQSAVVCAGDICDRGPDSLMALHTAYYKAYTVGVYDDNPHSAFEVVLGNHDHKLMRALGGAQVQLTNGLEQTMFQVTGVGHPWVENYRRLLAKWPLMAVLRTPDGQQAVVVHAGYYEGMLNDPVEKVAPYALFGPRDGVTPEGFPNRIEWENTYEGKDFVFYGHRIIGETPRFVNHTCGVDTGCYESGVLTAVSFPELHVLQVKGVPAHG
jgi:hypothetical protein